MGSEDAPLRFLPGREAVRRTVSWARMSWCVRVGHLIDAEEIEGGCTETLQQACARGEIAIANSVGPAQGNDIDAIMIGCGALHSWLAIVPIETLCGRALPAPTSARGDLGVVPPLLAVQGKTGECAGVGALHASYARRAHWRGWLADHENGAEMSGAALMRVEEMEAADKNREDERAATVEGMRAEIVMGKRPAFARGADGVMRRLTHADFAPDIMLDMACGRFLPHSSLGLDSGAFEVAQRACKAIGDIFVASLDELPPRRVAKAAAERRAESLLRQRLTAWLDSGEEMSAAPLKAKWVHGEGAEITGAVNAAKRVWDKIIAEDERFAKLLRPGRRPLEKQQAKSNR